MKHFTADDMPLVLDATFALALHAYALVLKDHVENDFKITDVLMDRFKAQGFDDIRSRRVASVINEALVKLLKDAKEKLE